MRPQEPITTAEAASFAAILLLLAFIVLGLLRCQPIPEPLPPDPVCDAGPDPWLPDADAASNAEIACMHLSALGCPEGFDSKCAYTIDLMIADRFIDSSTAICWTLSDTKEKARGCGSLECK